MRLGGRDVAGLLLAGDMYGAPVRRPARHLSWASTSTRLRGIVARWRRAGYAATGRLGPGPAWCWLTSPGLEPSPGCPTRPARPAAGPAGAHPRGAGRPPVVAGRPRLRGRAGVVAQRAAYPCRRWRPCRRRSRARRRSVLARPSRQRLRRAVLGHRSRTDPQTAGPHGRDHDRHAGPHRRLPPRPPRPARPALSPGWST